MFIIYNVSCGVGLWGYIYCLFRKWAIRVRVIEWLASEHIIFEIKGIVRMTNCFASLFIVLVFMIGYWIGINK